MDSFFFSSPPKLIVFYVILFLTVGGVWEKALKKIKTRKERAFNVPPFLPQSNTHISLVFQIEPDIETAFNKYFLDCVHEVQRYHVFHLGTWMGQPSPHIRF